MTKIKMRAHAIDKTDEAIQNGGIMTIIGAPRPPKGDPGDKFTWKDGDLQILKEGEGEPILSEAELDRILSESASEDRVLNWMRKHGLEVTRENYIAINWGSEPPDPWTAEHEADLPEELQDWSKVEPEDDEEEE